MWQEYHVRLRVILRLNSVHQAFLYISSIQLIERFYDPLAGTVYLDDEPITDFNVSEYRKHIALVSQEPVSHLNSRVLPMFIADVISSDPVCWQYSLQHPPWCDEAGVRSYAGGYRGCVPRREHPRLHPVPSRVCVIFLSHSCCMLTNAL